MKLSEVIRCAIAMKRAIPEPARQPQPAGADGGFVSLCDLPTADKWRDSN